MLILQISQAQIIELMKSVEGLRGAIVVLSQHQLGAFPQLTIDFLSMSSHVHNPTGDELDHVSSWIAMHQNMLILQISQAQIIELTKNVRIFRVRLLFFPSISWVHSHSFSLISLA